MTGTGWQILALIVIALAVSILVYATWWRPGSDGPDEDGPDSDPGELEPDDPQGHAYDPHPAELARELDPELLAELDAMEARELERMRALQAATTGGES